VFMTQCHFLHITFSIKVRTECIIYELVTSSFISVQLSLEKVVESVNAFVLFSGDSYLESRYTCYTQRSKTLIERKNWPHRVVALQKEPQREIACCGCF